ncbi:hypothetical protein ACFW04_014226 [Cataglyphis niger]
MPARRENRKERAKGGIITAVNKSLQEVSIRDMSYQAVEIKLRYNENRWRIITVYSQDVEETMQIIREQIQEEKEEVPSGRRRFQCKNGKSINKMVNREGRILEKIEERGWILNGSFDNKGGWTYIGERGASVVDYVIRNEKAEAKIKMIVEGDRTESDHVPLEVVLEGPETNIIRQERKTKVIEKSDWTEEGRESYYVKKDYKIWCEEERKKHEKEEEEKINNIRTEAEAWKYINKYSKKRERIDEGMKLESWNNYFMDLLEGTKRRVVLELEEGMEEEEENEKEIQDLSKEELIRQLEKLKMAKARGEDVYGEMEDWNKEIISPIYKKSEKSEVKNYRGVTLMDTSYKIYAGILNETNKNNS